MAGAIKIIVACFKEYFGDYLNTSLYSTDNESSMESNVSRVPFDYQGVSLPYKMMLTHKQPLLSIVEFQALFVTFLGLHENLLARVNFTVDIALTKKSMAKGGKKTKKKGGDFYDYKASRKSQKPPSRKKRTLEPFAESKLRKKEELEVVEEEKEEKSQGEKRFENIFEKFAYAPVHLANQRRPKPAPRQVNNVSKILAAKKAIDKSIPQSNLFFTGIKTDLSQSQPLSSANTQASKNETFTDQKSQKLAR